MLECRVTLQRQSFAMDVDTVFPQGVTAIVGASGAGKSTLLRMIAGLEPIDEGRVALNGRVWTDSARGKSLKPRKRRIGMVFQEPRLLPHLDVLGNVTIGRRGRLDIDAVLTATGVTHLIDRPVTGLSGGERQRVMLARALVAQPSVLLLDEPFSALHQLGREELLAMLQPILARLNVPVLFVSHSFEEAARLANRFVHLDGGRLVAEGRAGEVFARAPLGLPEDTLEQVTRSTLQTRVTGIAGGVAQLALGSQHIEAPAADLGLGDEANVTVLARDLIVAKSRLAGISARNQLSGIVSAITPLPGGQVEVCVVVEGQTIRALLTSQSAMDLELAEGHSVVLVFKVSAVRLGS